MPKHAYLIMAHHRFDLLEELLKDLDDSRNDIFLHVDAKTADFDADKTRRIVTKANLTIIPRMKVYWGGYSQIVCVMKLLEIASAYDYHAYYHFMVGVEFPLKSQDFIHDFFEKNSGKEFIGFDLADKNYMDRIKYFHIFNECGRPWNFLSRKKNEYRERLVKLQMRLDIDLLGKTRKQFMKGDACWSLTHDFVKFLLSQKPFVEKTFRHSFCGDEIFVHTILYNSEFRDRVYDFDNEYHSCMRMHTWEDPKNQYHLKDVDALLASGRLSARKLDGLDGLQAITEIRSRRE